MDDYLLLKLIHIISSTILLGTGVGSAFSLLMAVRSGNVPAIRTVTQNVVWADWLFTTPAVIVQPVTGLWLMHILNFPFDSLWFYWVVGLYLVAGSCWVPVVYIQIRMRNLLADEKSELPQEFNGLFRAWVLLGIPAFLAVLGLFYLMVFKPLL